MFVIVFAQNLGKSRKFYAKKQTKSGKFTKSGLFQSFYFENQNIWFIFVVK